MNILICAAGNKAGGGIQVADSLCRNLYRFPQHHFTVVLSKQLSYLVDSLKAYTNLRTESYTTDNNVKALLTGRDTFLDSIVDRDNINVVFFIFGPSLWIPKVLTVCGFAMPHLVLKDSPFWRIISKKELFLTKIRLFIQKRSFAKLSNYYYTENHYITHKFSELFPQKTVVTISNTCHQIFRQPDNWNRNINLPPFDGFSLITICANYLHKNLLAIPSILDCLAQHHPSIKVRFILTVEQDAIPNLQERHKNSIVFIGRVNINQCPYLYEQSDAVFLPSMLECFSANYAEAMTMKKPILTSDLGFAHSLCKDAAIYFDPSSPSDMTKKIVTLATDEKLRNRLIYNGSIQLSTFETAESRSNKIISLIERAFDESK